MMTAVGSIGRIWTVAMAIVIVVAAVLFVGCIDNGVAVKAYTLTVNVNPVTGGSVSRSPNKTTYNSGEQVIVTAATVEGYRFTGWSGASSSANSSVTVTMNSDLTLTANFQQETYTLTTGANPTIGGSVSRSPNKTTYAYGEQVTVTADPLSGYTFTGWSGASNSTNSNVTVTMNSNLTLTANFQQDTYTLTTGANPTIGGSVSSSPNKATYTYGEQVTVTADPLSGYTFTGWSGASTSTTSAITITMNENKTLTANFQEQVQPPQSQNYRISIMGNEIALGGRFVTVSVTINPLKASYTYGESVTISAPQRVNALNGNSYASFSYWLISQGLDGNGTVNTSNSVTITVTGNILAQLNYDIIYGN